MVNDGSRSRWILAPFRDLYWEIKELFLKTTMLVSDRSGYLGWKNMSVCSMTFENLVHQYPNVEYLKWQVRTGLIMIEQ